MVYVWFQNILKLKCKVTDTKHVSINDIMSTKMHVIKKGQVYD